MARAASSRGERDQLDPSHRRRMTPLWHEGQRVWVTVLIGVVVGAVMAFVQAAVTGWWLLRLLHPLLSRAGVQITTSAPVTR